MNAGQGVIDPNVDAQQQADERAVKRARLELCVLMMEGLDANNPILSARRIFHLLSSVSDVVQVNLRANRVTAFVEMVTGEDASRVVAQFQGYRIWGSQLLLSLKPMVTVTTLPDDFVCAAP